MKKHRSKFAIFVIAILILSQVQVVHLGAEITSGENDREFVVFGSNTSDDSNPDPVFHSDLAVTIEANGGKISSSVDGISFLYEKMPDVANFEIAATATVEHFDANNQVSFGLMLRDDIGENRNSAGHESNYVAVGGLDQEMKGFYKKDSLIKLDMFSDNKVPGMNEEYQLSIKKTGDTYILTSNGETETFTADEIFSDDIHVGVYAARGAKVRFDDITLIESQNVSDVIVDEESLEKREYLVGESLDLTGLEVTAVYDEDTTEVLSPEDYVVTGFDSSEAGTNTLTIHYNGLTKTIDVEILPYTITDLAVKYYPAKEHYYVGDAFYSEGLVVEATYNDGFAKEDLSDELYTLSVDDKVIEEGAILEEPGTHQVVVASTEQPEVSTTFTIEVSEEKVQELEVRQLPSKEVYFIGDELDLSGMAIYALYSDGHAVRLSLSDIEVAGFDTETVGSKELLLSYKQAEATVPITVKEKELEQIEIQQYPSTTFAVGDSFTRDGLTVAKVYDNGESKLLEEQDFEVDVSAFNSDEPGVYPIEIIPTMEEVSPITYSVTVREGQEVEWKSTHFGQSTSAQNNKVEILDDGVVKLIADNGGKITGDHDGLSFYYTELDANEDNFVLSADINVLNYAKDPHDGQESFGIMARDAIGEEGNSAVFASNIAAVGGFSGGTREPNGTQLLVRTGVLASDGEGSQGLQRSMINDTKPTLETTETDYRLTLAKTNSGFVGQLNDGEEHILFEPEILNVQNDKMYVGFYAARVATIEVSNIDLSVSAAATDAPKVEPPEEPVKPNVEITSLTKTGDADYSFKFQSNVDGRATVRQEHDILVEDMDVTGNELVELDTTLEGEDITNFTVVFVPDDTQNLTDYGSIVDNFTVTVKTFADEGGNIYVSPEGENDADGSKEQPLDLDTAIDYVQKGQTIIVQEGHYVRSERLEIAKYNDGTEEDRKVLMADPDAENRPVIDFDKLGRGVVHSGDYWHVKGIDFARSAPNYKGYHVGGSHNIIENVAVYENGDTGLQISRADRAETIDEWPSNNLILNSMTFDNRDPSENNADGFAAKLTVGEGNVFRGSISHNNIDDGWDLYTKVGTGAIGAVTIENSIAFNNGYVRGSDPGQGSKNGFKLGGEGVHVPHVIRNSIAFGNGAVGFDSNSNPGIIAENNYAFDNEGRNIGFTTYSNIEEDFTIDGFISFHTEDVSAEERADEFPSRLVSERNFMFDGTETANDSGDAVPQDVLDVLATISEFEKDEDGQIIWGDIWDTFNEFMEQYEQVVVDDDKETDDEQEDPSQPGNEPDDGLIDPDEEEMPVITDGELELEGDTLVVELSIKDGSTPVYLTKEQVKQLKEQNAFIHIQNGEVELIVPSAILTEEEVFITLDKLADVSDAVSSVYDFTIEQAGKEINDFGNEVVTMSFNVDSQAEVAIYYLNEEEEKWELIGGSYQDGKITADVHHFSTFTVFEQESEQVDTSKEAKDTDKPEAINIEESSDDTEGDGGFSLPDTATNIFNWALAGVVLLVIGTVIVIFARKRKA
ncbi:bacterial Ig-like domain-containing protein [Gracilibacillus sp. S3-1-1]|uniref:Bacterial Ig-like domain-containing protein n=1 Tax=Gracilibacillus pellucidus TaxID=3095368 RepID=A0ACC6M612_9BACI|nr:bacterial Ig-like domain-containing protein [Gracilibacillus sp. S3-1-1]MDX8046401.1 bacterial Ig-like domain-containing protein [Gracilibacillus sp. S3-1-1]